MSKQLRLVESPPAEPDGRAGARPRTTRARTSRAPRARRVRWADDWRLDAPTRAAGREGVAAARQALANARRDDADLRRAS